MSSTANPRHLSSGRHSDSRPARLRLAMTRRLSVVMAAVIAVPVLAVAVASAAPTATQRPSGKLVPATGVLLGAYTNLAGTWTSAAATESEVASREAQLGRTYDIDNHFYAWNDAFPTDQERNDLKRGRIPLVSWAGANLAAIAAGSMDAWITARADAAKAYGAPFFLRWNWEMNGNWNPNGGPASNSAGQTDGPAKYVAAWRHIHDIFVARGATNAVWVWAPNATSVPVAAWNTWQSYYPGDAYVDWVGVSSYNWGNLRSWSTWHSMTATVQGLYSVYSQRKPMMITETASTESGGDKAAWIADARVTVPRDFPSIAAVVWFDENKETNWRIDSSSAALAAFVGLAKDPVFNPRAAAATSPAPTPATTTPTATPTPVVSTPIVVPPVPTSTTPAPAPTTSTPTALSVKVVWTATASKIATTTRALAGSTVSGMVYVRALPSAPVAKVEFFVDDPSLVRAPLRTEKWAPYDLGGTSSSGQVVGYDASKLSVGQHRLTVRATTASGTVTVAQIAFAR